MLIIRIDFKVYNALIPYTLEELEETKGLSTILSAKEQGKLPIFGGFFCWLFCWLTLYNNREENIKRAGDECWNQRASPARFVVNAMFSASYQMSHSHCILSNDTSFRSDASVRDDATTSRRSLQTSGCCSCLPSGAE